MLADARVQPLPLRIIELALECTLQRREQEPIAVAVGLQRAVRDELV
jgi:hypothetical protein